MSEAQYRILADTGGLVVTDDGRRVVVIDRRIGALSVLAFALGVGGVVLIVFGVVAWVDGLLPGVGSVGLLALGVVLAALTIWLIRTIRGRRAAPLGSCRPAAVLDRKLGLFSAGGGALMNLADVRFERRLQVSSSAAKLVAVTPSGVLVLKRGTPFDGGVGDAHDVLNSVVQTNAEGARGCAESEN